MPAPIQLYVEHEDAEVETDSSNGNRIAKLCVGAFTVLQVPYWSYKDYENDEKAAEAIARELRRRLK